MLYALTSWPGVLTLPSLISLLNLLAGWRSKGSLIGGSLWCLLVVVDVAVVVVVSDMAETAVVELLACFAPISTVLARSEE